MSFPIEKFYVSHFAKIHNLKKILESRSLQPPKLQRQIFKEKKPEEEWSGSDYYENAKERGGDIEKYDKSIFYSILFPDSKGNPIFRDTKSRYVYFIFSPRIIEDNSSMIGRYGITEPPVFCEGWSYGKIKEEDCRYYNKDLTLEENLNSWRDSILYMIKDYEEDPSKERLIQAESDTLNAELLMEGEMPIDMDLLYIYIPNFESIFEYNYTEEQLKKFPFLVKAKESMEKQKKELETLIKEYPDLPWTRENPFKQV
jgi:hypothetical protein